MNVHRVWLALRIRVFFSLFSVWSSHFPKEASISCVCRKVCTFPIIFNTLYIYRVFASWRFAPSLFSLPHSPYIHLTSGTSELSLIILNVERNDRINYLHRIYPIYRRSIGGLNMIRRVHIRGNTMWRKNGTSPKGKRREGGEADPWCSAKNSRQSLVC